MSFGVRLICIIVLARYAVRLWQLKPLLGFETEIFSR
jgi:hypothetical protein